jgi:hypothetical protein
MGGREQYPEMQKSIEELRVMGKIKTTGHHCFTIKAKKLE